MNHYHWLHAGTACGKRRNGAASAHVPLRHLNLCSDLYLHRQHGSCKYWDMPPAGRVAAIYNLGLPGAGLNSKQASRL